MFERYTEKARRVIFFSRYEASQLGSPYIDTEHLLLGLIREDAGLRMQLSGSSPDEPESIRRQIESHTPVGEKISTSVDLPLSRELNGVLAYASAEAKALQHPVIDSGHLVLGLLRMNECFGADLLQQRGLRYERYREVVGLRGVRQHDESERSRRGQDRPVERPSRWQSEEKEPAAPSLGPAVAAMQRLVDQAIERFELYSPDYGEQRLKRKPWSRKQALGHLIDLATAHHQLFARALTEPRVTVNAYPEDDWVRVQDYENGSWPDIVDSWISLNRLLVHVLMLIPEEKLTLSCRIGIEEPISLLTLITRYAERCEDIVGQILSKL